MGVKPETPLPWEDLPEIPDADSHAHGTWLDADYDFAIHACNAYPKLVEFVRRYAEYEIPPAKAAQDLIVEIGEL